MADTASIDYREVNLRENSSTASTCTGSNRRKFKDNGFRMTSLQQQLCSSNIWITIVASFLIGLLLGKFDIELLSNKASNMHSIVMKEATTSADSSGAVLVTGATGRTGSLLYHELKRRGVSDVRAFVRNITKAQSVLGCTKCDESEGVYLGDVTKPEDLERAMMGPRSGGSSPVTTIAIAVGGSSRLSPDMQRQVEFDSVVHSVKALAHAHENQRNHLRVVLCSSMGTNQARPPSFFANILFWKLNAETFLSTSALSSTIIVKPCGLPEGMVGKNSTLVVGHNGTIMAGTEYHSVSREDVANVMAESVVMANECGKSKHLRFDLCSRPGPVTTDLKGLIDEARWEWDH